MAALMLNYRASAELFPGRPGHKASNKYQRFSRADTAIRFAIEQLQPEFLRSTVLEVDGERFDAGQIRQFYADEKFPLKRKAGWQS